MAWFVSSECRFVSDILGIADPQHSDSARHFIDFAAPRSLCRSRSVRRQGMIARTSSAAWVKGVVDMFSAEGLDVEELFDLAGLDLAALNDPAGRFPIDDVSVLWQLAVARSGKTTLGLSRELTTTYGNLDVVAYAMMTCQTLLEGLDRLARYMNVVSDAATFVLTPAAGGYWL